LIKRYFHLLVFSDILDPYSRGHSSDGVEEKQKPSPRSVQAKHPFPDFGKTRKSWRWSGQAKHEPCKRVFGGEEEEKGNPDTSHTSADTATQEREKAPV
jgi:hypothetical protein